jgi:C-terminal processing protease CtpA/Prc
VDYFYSAAKHRSRGVLWSIFAPALISAKGTQIEGNGITPDIPIPWSFEDVAAGIDRQLVGAVEALRAA